MTTTVCVRVMTPHKISVRCLRVPLAQPPRRRIDVIQSMSAPAQERVLRLAYLQFARRVGLPLVS